MLRDDSIVESAKQRSLRVPLDHFVRKDWIVRSKYFLTAAAAAIAAVYVAWMFLGGRAGQMQASPGPLAAAHAGWDNDCQVCHQNLKPLRSDAVHLTSLGASRASIRESLDQKCIQCHNEPEHHHAAKPDEVMSCSACHRDHRGRMADIVRPKDNTCLGCHREIANHRNGNSALTEETRNVLAFGPMSEGGEGPHPDFRSLRSDPGNIKFNHWLHMQPGQAEATARPEAQKRLPGVVESYREQYAKYVNAAGLVALDCYACHEADASGRHMKPIAYLQHCQGCHPLQLRLPKGETLTPDQSLTEGEAFAELPHGLKPLQLAPAVDDQLRAQLQKQTPPKAEERSATPRIPGRTLGNNLAQEIHRDIRGNASKAVTLQCQLCHETSPSGEATVALPNVLEPKIPAQWFRHARFDHAAHRQLHHAKGQENCRECHAAAFAFEKPDQKQFIKPTEGAALAIDSEKVMIAGLEKCASCHAAAPEVAGSARHDCAECHDYHDRDKLFGAKPSSVTALRVQGSGFRVQEIGQELSASPALLDIRLASFTSLAATASPIVGAGSCASVGCHGEVRPKAPVWQTSLTKFFASDPHAQAYDVLWTFRGREMTRLLAATEKTDEQPLSDAAHFGVVQERCIGCHATPLPEGAVVNENSYIFGVHCESCHGAGGGWLHSHYQTAFEKNESVRSAAPGFVDTKKLDSRAGACMKCHVGPNDAAAGAQVVDHDLVAAGHPRLAFEFHAYFESLPEHWNRQADEAKHPDAFHFRSWLAGHSQAAEHKKALAEKRPLDFANLDCFACHHSLAAESWRQPAKFDSLKAVPWPSLALPQADGEVSLADRLELARNLIVESKDDGRWDAALLSYLATEAIVGDIRRDQRSQVMGDLAKLNSALGSLAAYLGETSFAGSGRADSPRAGNSPTIYDSPTAFNPKSPSYAERITPVLEVLNQLKASTTAR